MLAAVVRLLDTEHLRVGNEEYARDNKSFGATTLRNRHVKRSGAQAQDALHRQARHRPRSHDHRPRRSTRIVRQCQDLPGQKLFQYVNGDGEPQPITSADVNDYIREATGGEFTAKHFRTWGASVIAFDQLLDAERARRRSASRPMLEPVAEALGNTAAISRKSYVHPALIEAAKERPRDPLPGIERPPARKWLSSAEVGLLNFLKRQSPPRRKLAKAA